MHFAIAVLLVISWTLFSDAHSVSGPPCVFEGHVSTWNNWYGYLANISVKQSGRMLFEFTYSSERCCINVLFYTEEQASKLTTRMNCWQKEYLLPPEDDQIMRLTPRFSWSGCHVTHTTLRPVYTCEGGRSFGLDRGSSGPSAWFIAVSNCATRFGLDMSYRITVYEYDGQCNYQSIVPPYSQLALSSDAGPMSRHTYHSWVRSTSVPSCVVEGKVRTEKIWYGFLMNVTLKRGGGFHFHIEFPLTLQQQSVYLILYTESDVARLGNRLTCWQRYGVVRPRNTPEQVNPYSSGQLDLVPEQVIELNAKSSWNGCASENTTGSGLVVNCNGQRRFDEPRTLHVAVMNCRSSTGIDLRYRFDAYGFDESQVCSASRVVTSSLLAVCAVATLWRFSSLHFQPGFLVEPLSW